MVVRGFLSFLLDMLAPPLCVHCGSEILEAPSLEGVSVPAGWPSAIVSFFDQRQRVLCLDCWLGLEPARNPSPLGLRAPERGEPMLITPFFTNEVLLSIVRYLKFEGGVQAADSLSWWMAGALRRCGDLSDAPALIIPVPLHGRRRRKRGYNQAALLAGRVAECLGLPFDDRALIRCRHTRSQARLGESARERNVRDAFHLGEKSRVKGRHIVLVDDLVTSGGTIRSCIGSFLPADPCRVTVLAAGRRKRLSYRQIGDRMPDAGKPGGGVGSGMFHDDRS